MFLFRYVYVMSYDGTVSDLILAYAVLGLNVPNLGGVGNTEVRFAELSSLLSDLLLGLLCVRYLIKTHHAGIHRNFDSPHIIDPVYIHADMADPDAEQLLKNFAPDLYNGRYLLRKVCGERMIVHCGDEPWAKYNTIDSRS